ncbi:MAG TPA: hypothetical protein DCE41_00265 [Cytophagales bacterium]|nr:hypothetical protein [Cytophagales bacterium]HAA22938.1 hypothetical protein [Cytophagales bacterium]
MNWRKRTYQSASDETLIQWVAQQDKRAFDTLYERYATPLYRYLYRLLWKNQALAEDFLQDTFLRVLQAANKFEAGKTFRPWLYSIAHNLCKNEYRRKAIRGEAVELGEDMTWEMPKGAATHDEDQWRAALSEAVNGLSEAHKSVFLLRYEQNLELAEIAEILSVPLGTVKSRMFHLQKRLAKELEAFQILLES